MFDQQLKSVNWQQPPWSTHYPELVNIFQDHPCVPAYNNISHNEYCRSMFIDITAKEWNQWLTIVDDNTNTCQLNDLYSIADQIYIIIIHAHFSHILVFAVEYNTVLINKYN